MEEKQDTGKEFRHYNLPAAKRLKVKQFLPPEENAGQQILISQQHGVNPDSPKRGTVYHYILLFFGERNVLYFQNVSL